MKLLWRIIMSLVLAAGILMLLEQGFKFGLQHNRNFKLSHIRLEPIGADIIVNGTCQSELSVDPEILAKYIDLKTYNLSMNHSNFADNYLFLTEYLKFQKKPKVVLLYVSPDSFAQNGTNIFNSFRFSSLLDDENVNSTVKDFDNTYVQVSKIPFLKYSYYSNFIFYPVLGGYLDFLVGRRIPEHPNGFVLPRYSYMRSGCFQEIMPDNGVYKWSPLMEKYFLKTIELLNQQKIPLLVYEGPVYIDAVKKHKNRADALHRIDSICKAQLVPFLKFDTLTMNHDIKNFFSTHNTTIEGNAIFNPILAKMLKDTLPNILNKQNVK